jgi:hypothetical protein
MYAHQTELSHEVVQAMNEPNINEIAASVIQGQVNNAIGAVSKAFKAAVTKILEVMKKDLTKYTATKIKKCSYVRTPIINRDHSVNIHDIYVQTRLKVKSQIVRDDNFISTLAHNDSVVVAGSAGSGKSMFMRYLFLKQCSVKHSKIPLFFELRDINSSEKKNLQEFLYYNLIGSSATISESQFLESLKAGVFSLILDGFDEIHHTDRKEIESQIRKMRDQCPELQIIISSRPDPESRLDTWQAFRSVHVEPMEQPQSIELIDRLEYDAKVKEKFLKEIKGRLFQTHKTFLSNPLLCIMMLVTFEQTGHIPTKRHVFYERAFDALFLLHDTAKEGVYKRKTYSNLSVDDFRNCMSAFCIVTYLKEQFVLSRAQLRDSIQQALELEEVETNIDDLISDMIESTCLIQVEGTDFAFTHRSFQEYFAAVFISRSPAVGASALLEQASLRQTDDVVNLAFSINRGLVEREWIVPILERLINAPAAQLVSQQPMQFLKENVGGIFMSIGDEGRVDLSLYFKSDAVKLLSIANLYFNRFPGISLLTIDASPADREKANTAYVNMVRTRDERLTKAPSRVPGRTRDGKAVHATRVIELNPSDSDWIKQTSLPIRLIEFVEAARQIVDHCKEDARKQENIIRLLTRAK